MITQQAAKAKIQALLDTPDPYQRETLELLIADALTIEKEWGRVFFYTSKKFLETQDYQYALGGNAPYIVNRFDGSIHDTGTAYPIEYYIDQYEGNHLENQCLVITG